MHEITFKGLRCVYRTWGQGRPVVLLHFGGGSGVQWEKMATALASDCRAIAPDLVGAGDTASWPVADALTHDVQADLVAALIDTNADRPVDIVGHSYGGATAVRLAVNQPQKARSLMLIEPILNCLLAEARDPLLGDSERVGRAFVAAIDDGRPEAAWELFIDARNGAGTWARLSERRRSQFVADADRGKAAMLSNLNNRTTFAECRSIGVPTTVVCGAETTAPDRRVTEILRDTIPGVHYEVLAGAAHMSPLTHSLEVAQLVRDHLGRAGS